MIRHLPYILQPEVYQCPAEDDGRNQGVRVGVYRCEVLILLGHTRANMVSAHRRIPEDRGRRLESKELVDEHIRRDSEEGKERLEENPRGLAVRADDTRVGAADDRP